MKSIIYLLLIGIAGCLAACRPGSIQPMPEAAEAEQLLNSRPESLAGITPAAATQRKQRICEHINQSREKPLYKNLSIDIYLWEY